MDREKTIKVAGIIISIVGFGVTIVQGILDDNKLDGKIAKEVEKQLNNR